MSKVNQMWGGRFDLPPSELMQEINASLPYDRRLYAQDIRGSKAHAAMLAKQGILTSEEEKKIQEGLSLILKEIEDGRFDFRRELEDIHMAVEARLKELIGDAGGKLHTARSRNDQVAVDMKLFVREECEKAVALLKDLRRVLKKRAQENVETIMPGFTHLQVAQPISFGFYLHAYYEMFGRDIKRFENAFDVMGECPLGAAALAGTPYDTNRFFTAEQLGFKAPTKNALDSVSDRDFVLEYLSCASICAMHLSRLAEEMVVFSSQPFGFVKMPQEYTSGSSIMPQKCNPDAAELMRAKTGRIYGSLTTLLTVMKGLPLAYSKDMQEDKEALFDACDTLVLELKVMTAVVEGLTVRADNMRKALENGFPTATDLADWLVKKANIPFREAHHITGTIVKFAEQNGLRLMDVPLKEMQKVCPQITQDVYAVLNVESSLNARKSYGGTAPDQLRQRLSEEV
ncbi:MAG: argininosuccinate lyase [Alphaproteobacteria bacterium]|nr:argininosuccinate lyase [Alphaproteobacteria bacterium]